MRAAVYKGPRTLSVEEVPTPEPGPNQVLVKVKYCAICGTDVHGYMYDVPPPGTVMGHEYCGTVARLGPGVTKWHEGDRVVGGGGTPPPGKETRQRVAPRYDYLAEGFVHPMRAYAEFVLMDEWLPIPVPEGVSDEEAALCEPCAVAVHAVRLSRLRVGDSVAILGAGPIGLFCTQVAKAAGAGRVIVSEPTETRAAAAMQLGADHVLDPTKDDVVSRAVELTDDIGPDIVFDCAGIKSTLDEALNMVRRRGQVMLVAVPWEEMPLAPVAWMALEVSVQTSFGQLPEDWRIALDLFKSGKVQIGPMLSEEQIIPLDGIQEAFDSLMKPTTQLQMVVKP